MQADVVFGEDVYWLLVDVTCVLIEERVSSCKVHLGNKNNSLHVYCQLREHSCSTCNQSGSYQTMTTTHVDSCPEAFVPAQELYLWYKNITITIIKSTVPNQSMFELAFHRSATVCEMSGGGRMENLGGKCFSTFTPI